MERSEQKPYLPEHEQVPETLSKTDIIAAFDLDGTILKGPYSIGHVVSEVTSTQQHGIIFDPAAVDSFPEHQLTALEKTSNAVARILHRGRKPYPGIHRVLETIGMISQQYGLTTKIAVISGRSEELLGNLSRRELDRHNLTKFLKNGNEEPNIFLKPDGISSWKWKCFKLWELTHPENGSFKQAIFYENDPVTAKKIAEVTLELQMPVTVVLHKRLETSPLVLQALGMQCDPRTGSCFSLKPDPKTGKYQELPIFLASVSEFAEQFEAFSLGRPVNS
ncbi:MAG: hypothetical protein ACOX6V_03100 [Patescibacteria group bacterium]|jgi:hypothetical protein